MEKINIHQEESIDSKSINRRQAVKWTLAGLNIPPAFDLLFQSSDLLAANVNAAPDDGPRPGGVPLRLNPYGWPREESNQRALHAFYGHPLDNSHIVKVRSPWPLRLAWDLTKTREHFLAHSRIADPLSEVLAAVLDHYGLEEIERMGLHLFGGDHVDRGMKGSTMRWSTHAWGIAFDFDPSNNRYHWGQDRARFARPEYDAWWAIWERHGFYSLGRHKNYDWMHIQAAWRP